MTDWDAIVADHGPAVWGTLWRLLGHRADVEDCFQETFIAALNVSRRQEVDCWTALLTSVATARAMDRLRQRYRRGERGREAVEPAGDVLARTAGTEAGPSEQAIAAELSERLRRALLELPPQQAEVFCLHVFCGWSHRDLGHRLNLTDNAVGVTLHRARQRLRELLEEVG